MACDFARHDRWRRGHEVKISTFPQGLKPSKDGVLAARLKSCPSRLCFFALDHRLPSLRDFVLIFVCLPRTRVRGFAISPLRLRSGQALRAFCEGWEAHGQHTVGQKTDFPN